MQEDSKRSPNEIVAQRIVERLEAKGKALSAKRLSALADHFSAGALSISDAESLFEFDRHSEGDKE